MSGDADRENAAMKDGPMTKVSRHRLEMSEKGTYSHAYDEDTLGAIYEGIEKDQVVFFLDDGAIAVYTIMLDDQGNNSLEYTGLMVVKQEEGKIRAEIQEPTQKMMDWWAKSQEGKRFPETAFTVWDQRSYNQQVERFTASARELGLTVIETL